MRTILKKRFLENPHRHHDIVWDEIEARLKVHPEALIILQHMEETGGEPDVIGVDKETGEVIFVDCAKESPQGRCSLCYDDEALKKRKKNPPRGSAMSQAQSLGVEMMDEAMYRQLQNVEVVDLKTSSWIFTPASIRQLGGALFCERRYNHVFTFHNSADSYYGVRGWRGVLRI